MSQILINQIWQHKKFKYRVLFIDEVLDVFIWIKLIDNKPSFPEEISYSWFLDMINADEVTVIEHKDVFVNSNSLEQKSLEKLEKSWQIIKDHVNKEPQIYDKKLFNKLCSLIANQNKVSRHTVSRLFLKYWINGKVKIGLAPKYYKSGGKGKDKTFTAIINGRRSAVNEPAIIIDNKTKVKISRGYKRWYLNIEGASLKNAWLNFIRTSYKNKAIDTYPSFNQFIYWGSKSSNEEQKLISKMGKIAYDKDLRPKEGSSYNSYLGPGLSQIDSTPGDVEIVSELDDETPIGCPIIYTVADVFSGMILGVTVTLENPSFATASEALYYSFINKEKFFKDSLLYEIDGFDLRSKDWPVEHIPSSVVADNGIELISKNSTRLIENIGIQIENKESYRPELKGLIENTFKILHNDIKGIDNNIGYKSINDGRRGAKKARKTAKITMREYLAILIKTVVKYNNHQKLKNYPIDAEMYKQGLIEPTPIEIFKWGLKNRSGKLRASNISNLKEKMLPADTGKFFKNRIEFKKGWYHVPVNKKLHDFRLKLKERNIKVDVFYNPYNLNSIYFIHDKEVYECNLNQNKSPIYKNKTIWDVNDFLSKKSRVSNYIDQDIIDASVEVNNFTENLIKKKTGQKKKSAISLKKIGKEREKNKSIERIKKATTDNKPEKEKKEVKVIRMNRNLDAPDDLDLINKLLNGE
ncbi:MAG: hypothetical protein ACNS60_14180 [Candidatus Cyclobacteriaceae bacterium M2_1C_046]